LNSLFENIDRITSPKYKPTAEDVLACKTKTTGVPTYKFSFNEINFVVLDTGGQRNERRKWLCYMRIFN